jgi:hypothetical protein
MLHRDLFANSDEEIWFLSYNFCLEKRLDEPTQFKIRLQVARAHQPVRINPWLSFTHKGLVVRWKLASSVAGVFQARRSHVEAKECYRSRINKDELIEVTIDPVEPMRGGGTIRCLLLSQWVGRFTMWFERVQGSSKVIPTQFRIHRYKPLVENNENK